MNTAPAKNHMTTPAIVVELSLQGFVATTPDPVDIRNAAATRCPRCKRLGLDCRGYERPGQETYRIVLRCGCGWQAEA